MQKAFSIFQTIELITAALILFLLLATRLIGYTPYVVETGSMEPTLPTQSVAYVQRVNANNIKCNDIIAFHIEDKIITHRVVEVNDSECFTTKGDANQAKDPIAVGYDSCIGTVRFHIPYLGYLITFMKTISGKVFLGGIVIINIILSVIINLICKTENKNQINNERKKLL